MVYNEEIKQELLNALKGAEHGTHKVKDMDIRGNSEFFRITLNYGGGLFVSFYMDKNLGNTLSISSNYGGFDYKDITETYWDNGVYTGAYGGYRYEYKVKISMVRLVEQFKLYGLSAFYTLESLGA